MGRLSRVFSLTVLCLAITALPLPDAVAQEDVPQDAGVATTERVTTRTQFTPHPYAPGDTIGIRVVLYNLTDETLPIESPPCELAIGEGPGFDETLEARLVFPEGLRFSPEPLSP